MKYLMFLVLLMNSVAARAGTYGDCVIGNAKSALTTQAVYAIKEACMSKSSTSLGADVLAKLTGTLGVGAPYFSSVNTLYIRLRNDTPYTITALDVAVKTGSDFHTYRISRFDDVPPPGEILGPPPDITSFEKIPPFSSVYFYHAADEVLGKAQWSIVGARGFLSDP